MSGILPTICTVNVLSPCFLAEKCKKGCNLKNELKLEFIDWHQIIKIANDPTKLFYRANKKCAKQINCASVVLSNLIGNNYFWNRIN